MNEPYYDKDVLAVMFKQLESISPSTWHKVMNPYCGQCLLERGKATLEKWRKS